VKLKAHSSPQRTLKIETTDTGILLGNKEDFCSIYSIAFGLAHPIVSHSPDTVRFSPNSLIQPSNPSEINRTIDPNVSLHQHVSPALKYVYSLVFVAFIFPVFLLQLRQCFYLVSPLSSPPSSSGRLPLHAISSQSPLS
jgi:hypothetical protein